jgi:hypothetical protein
MEKLIALTGVARSGKSTIAKELAKYGYTRSKFSQTLKNMLLQIPGVTEEMTEGKLKELPQSILGDRTPRDVMQTLGTEWGRDLVSNKIWLDAWQRSVAHLKYVVVEDLRFPNEADLVKSLGGEIWSVTREGYTPDGHSSETEMSKIYPDVIIKNDSNKESLHAMLKGIVQDTPEAWTGEDIHVVYPLSKEKQTV